MKKRYIILLIIVLLVFFLYKPALSFHTYYLTDCAADGLEQQTEYDMYLETITPTDYAAMLDPYTSDFDISTIDTIVYNDDYYPIHKISITSTMATQTLVLFGATHGNEFASALVIPRWLEILKTHPDMYTDWNIHIVTPVNPVGLAHGSRYTQDGCDINRDFKNFETRGAQIQRDMMHTYSPDIVVSLHEGPHEDFYFFTNESVTDELTKKILTDLSEQGVHLAKTMSGSPIPLIPHGVATENFFSKSFKRVFDINLIGTYADAHGIGVITPESSWKSTDIDERIFPHIVLLNSILSSHSYAY